MLLASMNLVCTWWDMVFIYFKTFNEITYMDYSQVDTDVSPQLVQYVGYQPQYVGSDHHAHVPYSGGWWLRHPGLCVYPTSSTKSPSHFFRASKTDPWPHHIHIISITDVNPTYSFDFHNPEATDCRKPPHSYVKLYQRCGIYSGTRDGQGQTALASRSYNCPMSTEKQFIQTHNGCKELTRDSSSGHPFCPASSAPSPRPPSGRLTLGSV